MYGSDPDDHLFLIQTVVERIWESLGDDADWDRAYQVRQLVSQSLVYKNLSGIKCFKQFEAEVQQRSPSAFNKLITAVREYSLTIDKIRDILESRLRYGFSHILTLTQEDITLM